MTRPGDQVPCLIGAIVVVIGLALTVGLTAVAIWIVYTTWEAFT